MKLKGLLTFFTSIWRLPHVHSVAKRSWAFSASLDSQNIIATRSVAWPIFISGIESGSSCARTFCDWKIMYPLYVAAAKHFKLTRLFSYNINFYILASAIFYGDKPHKPTSRRSSLWINFKTVKDETRRVFTRLLKALPQIELENVSD